MELVWVSLLAYKPSKTDVPFNWIVNMSHHDPEQDADVC